MRVIGFAENELVNNQEERRTLNNEDLGEKILNRGKMGEE